MRSFFRHLNVVATCHGARLSVWACPPFLFVIMGVVNIGAMVASYVFSTRYVDQPEIAALIVIGVALLIFIIGNFIITGFSQIAEANRIKGEFIAIISHQLRSPLSIFKWTIDAMRQSARASNTTQNKAFPAGRGESSPDSSLDARLDIIHDNTEKMIQLVNMLLEVSRIESGRFLLQHQPVRLDLLTEDALHSFSAYVHASNISVDYASPKGLPPANGDQEKIKMVIQNLLDNAIRYSYGGSRIVITLNPENHSSLLWKIQDSGVGIPAEQQRYVFEKFFRSVNAMQHQAQGTGLGLYIARSVIEGLDGTIGFESAPGKGTIFWFRLPMYHGG